jgi:hypothetical protein
MLCPSPKLNICAAVFLPVHSSHRPVNSHLALPPVLQQAKTATAFSDSSPVGPRVAGSSKPQAPSFLTL